ncbi:MAG: hypothetical protein II609_06795 [Muribaculaceae bacterium]|nr:hypothetical protein [Muribaculaceae bacterium]
MAHKKHAHFSNYKYSGFILFLHHSTTKKRPSVAILNHFSAICSTGTEMSVYKVAPAKKCEQRKPLPRLSSQTSQKTTNFAPVFKDDKYNNEENFIMGVFVCHCAVAGQYSRACAYKEGEERAKHHASDFYR